MSKAAESPRGDRDKLISPRMRRNFSVKGENSISARTDDDAREAELEAGLTHALDLLSRMEEQTIALYQEKQGLEQEIETVDAYLRRLQLNVEDAEKRAQQGQQRMMVFTGRERTNTLMQRMHEAK